MHLRLLSLRFPSLRSVRPYLDLTLAMAIVGSMTSAGKLILDDFPIHLSMCLRFAAASLLSLVWLVLAEGKLPRVRPRSLGLLLVQALCGVYLTNVLMLYGLQRTSAAAAGIITATTPAAMALLARAFLAEPVTRRGVLGIGAAVVGVGVLNLAALEHGGTAGLVGNALMLAVVVAESGFLLLRKGIREPLSPLAATTWVSLIGLLLFLPQGLTEAVNFDFGAVSLSGWALILYYGAFVSVAAYYFWFRGVVEVSASTAGVFTAVMPLSALLCSALVVGERIGWEHASGCALVMAAIWFICRGGKGEQGAHEVENSER